MRHKNAKLLGPESSSLKTNVTKGISEFLQDAECHLFIRLTVDIVQLYAYGPSVSERYVEQ
jgi:hypothetical protein